MNKITAVIIEDEIPAARRLNNTLNELRPEWQITVLPGSVKKSVEWFAENPHPDLVFLDIQLTDGISFTFIEQAQPESTIIFTTAYDEYAIRAFTVNSIDYLLKPIDNIRLEEAIVKFEHLTTKYLNQGQKPIDLMEILQNITQPGKKYRTRFLISGDDKLFTLQVEDIAYFYSENKVTFAVTKQNRGIPQYSLHSVGAKLFEAIGLPWFLFLFYISLPFLLGDDRFPDKLQSAADPDSAIPETPDSQLPVCTDRLSVLRIRFVHHLFAWFPYGFSGKHFNLPVLHALLFMHIGRIHLHALYPAERKRAGNRTSSF